MLRLATLISGGGTTMARIFEECQSGGLTGIAPALVIASRPDAGGIEKAGNLGIPEKDILVLRPKDFASPETFGDAIIRACRDRGVDVIGQYGWLAKTPPNVINAFPGMIVNQHPGPLHFKQPDFGGKGMYGRRVHAARLYFVRSVGRDFWTEATAHRVTEEYDEGAVLKRMTVPIDPGDDPASLAARVLPIEYEVQIAALQDFANNTAQEVHRDISLVLPGEDAILADAKRAAALLFPHG